MRKRVFVVSIPRDLESLLHRVGALLVDGVVGRRFLVISLLLLRCRDSAMACECQQDKTPAKGGGAHDSRGEGTNSYEFDMYLLKDKTPSLTIGLAVIGPPGPRNWQGVGWGKAR